MNHPGDASTGRGSLGERLGAIFKAYDVRGVVPGEFDADLAERIGAATVAVLDAAGMVVGRDMRPSSPELVAAFAEGVRSQGCDVIDIGLASTDMLYFASGELDLPGAIFTASHNPPRYNGIKLCRAGAVPVSIDTGLAQIRDLVLRGGPSPTGERGGTRTDDVLHRYAEHVRSFIDPSLLRPLAVAVDAANGMAGHVVPPVFEPLPVKLVALHFELDGTFPNHPADPSDVRNLADLREAVRSEGADLGLAFDGDADRMFAVDETGEPVSPSLVAAVVAERLLERAPGSVVLYNLICSKVVPETIAAAGGKPLRTRVGHSFIKARMAETGAIFAAEHSGHYYFRDNYRADSGLIAALLLLEAVSVASKPLSEVVAPYARYANSGEVNFEVADQDAALEEVAEAFGRRGELDWTDGLTVEMHGAGTAWFNVRPSNTEPLLRLNIEAGDHDTVEQLREEIAAIVSGA